MNVPTWMIWVMKIKIVLIKTLLTDLLSHIDWVANVVILEGTVSVYWHTIAITRTSNLLNYGILMTTWWKGLLQYTISWMLNALKNDKHIMCAKWENIRSVNFSVPHNMYYMYVLVGLGGYHLSGEKLIPIIPTLMGKWSCRG